MEKKYTANFKNLPFELNLKVLLNPAFIKSKKYDSEKDTPFLKFKKIKNQKFFEIICGIIIKYLNGNTNQIKLGKNYDDFNLKKNEEYLVSSFQLKKCNSEVWDKLVNH